MIGVDQRGMDWIRRIGLTYVRPMYIKVKKVFTTISTKNLYERAEIFTKETQTEKPISIKKRLLNSDIKDRIFVTVSENDNLQNSVEEAEDSKNYIRNLMIVSAVVDVFVIPRIYSEHYYCRKGFCVG